VRALVLASVAVLLAGPAAAAARDAAHRQVLVELSAVLGESHAIRQACEGREDQFWRAPMLRLLEVEAAPLDFTNDLKGAFNDAYSSALDAYPACSPRSRQAEAEAAARGRALARRLSQSVAAPVPVSREAR